VVLYYFGLKIAFFLSVLRAYLKFEPLEKHGLFLAGLYTAGIAFISWVFLVAPQQPPVEWRAWEHMLVARLLGGEHATIPVIGWRAWQIWLVETFVLMAVYFKLLSRFDEGTAFWVVLIIGLGMILF
jgi:hypothetical protein